jgi:hypothetical protein
MEDPGMDADLQDLVEVEMMLAELAGREDAAGFRNRLEAKKHDLLERIDRRIPDYERERGRSAA